MQNLSALVASSRTHSDVLIVGSGLMGALVARRIRDEVPGARITMIDGAATIGTQPGQHLHDSDDAEIRRAFTGRAAVGVQSVYVGPSYPAHVGDTAADLTPGMLSVSSLDDDSDAMPSAAIAWNVGGMGVHWTTACPWPYDVEIVDLVPREEWDDDLQTAQRLLQVSPAPFSPSRAGTAVLSALREAFDDVSDPSRGVQEMPLAAYAASDGSIRRVGPNTIFPAMLSDDDEAFALVENALCVELVVTDATVTGARVRDVVDGGEHVLTAEAVIVCADPLRTPQLLWASGLRAPAVGAYLNEHAFLSGRVTVDLPTLGLDDDDLPSFRADEPFTNAYWLPRSGDRQPMHGQIMEFVNPRSEDGDELIYSIGASVYVPTEITAHNRIVFSDDETDTTGMPRMRIDFSYSPADLAAIERGREAQARLCTQLGRFDPAADSRLLPAGSSMHYTGTVRMGAVDDGTSVCDTDARVWGIENLYLAGGGVVPTALSCNSTLTAAVLAVRTTRAVAAALGGRRAVDAE